MRTDLTVITATIPGREVSLGQTLESVYQQNPEVEAHLVMAQSITDGLAQPHHASIMQNYLLPAVRTTWVMRLADDDRLLPHFTQTIMRDEILDGYDVIYSWDANHNRPRVDCTEWSHDHLCETLAVANFIEGSGVVIRTEKVQRHRWPENWVDGHFADMFANADDWGLWLRLARGGARFRCVPEETWVYGTEGL